MDYDTRSAKKNKRKGRDDPYSPTDVLNSDDSLSEKSVRRRKREETESSSPCSSSEDSSDDSSSGYEYTWEEAKPPKPPFQPFVTAVNVGSIELPAVKREFHAVIPLKAVLVILFPNNTPEELEFGIERLELDNLTKFEADLLTKHVKSLRDSDIRTFAAGNEIYVAEFSRGEVGCYYESLKTEFSSIMDTLRSNALSATHDTTKFNNMQSAEELSPDGLMSERVEYPRPLVCSQPNMSQTTEDIAKIKLTETAQINDIDTFLLETLGSSSKQCIVHVGEKSLEEHNCEKRKHGRRRSSCSLSSATSSAESSSNKRAASKNKVTVVLRHLFPENEEDEDVIVDPVSEFQKKVCKSAVKNESNPTTTSGTERITQKKRREPKGVVDGSDPKADNPSDVAPDAKLPVMTQPNLDDVDCNSDRRMEAHRCNETDANDTRKNATNTIAVGNSASPNDGEEARDKRKAERSDLRLVLTAMSTGNGAVKVAAGDFKSLKASKSESATAEGDEIEGSPTDHRSSVATLTTISNQDNLGTSALENHIECLFSENGPLSSQGWTVTDSYTCPSPELGDAVANSPSTAAGADDISRSNDEAFADYILESAAKKIASPSLCSDRQAPRLSKTSKTPPRRNSEFKADNLTRLGREAKFRNASSTDSRVRYTSTNHDNSARRVRYSNERYGGSGQRMTAFGGDTRIVQRTTRFVPDYSRLRFHYRPELYSPVSSSDADFGSAEDDELESAEKPKHKVLHRRSSRDDIRVRSRKQERGSDAGFERTCVRGSSLQNKARHLAGCGGSVPRFPLHREPTPDSEKVMYCQKGIGSATSNITSDIENLVAGIRLECESQALYVRNYSGKESFRRFESSSPRTYRRDYEPTRRLKSRRRSHSPSCVRSFSPSPHRSNPGPSPRRRSMTPTSNIIRRDSHRGNLRKLRTSERNSSRQRTCRIGMGKLDGDAGGNEHSGLQSSEMRYSSPQRSHDSTLCDTSHATNVSLCGSIELMHSRYSSPFAPIVQTCRNEVVGTVDFSMRDQTPLSAKPASRQVIREYGASTSFHPSLQLQPRPASEDEQVIILKGSQEVDCTLNELWPFFSGGSDHDSSMEDSCDGEIESFTFKTLNRWREQSAVRNSVPVATAKAAIAADSPSKLNKPGGVKRQNNSLSTAVAINTRKCDSVGSSTQNALKSPQSDVVVGYSESVPAEHSNVASKNADVDDFKNPTLPAQLRDASAAEAVCGKRDKNFPSSRKLRRLSSPVTNMHRVTASPVELESDTAYEDIVVQDVDGTSSSLEVDGMTGNSAKLNSSRKIIDLAKMVDGTATDEGMVIHNYDVERSDPRSDEDSHVEHGAIGSGEVLNETKGRVSDMKSWKKLLLRKAEKDSSNDKASNDSSGEAAVDESVIRDEVTFTICAETVSELNVDQSSTRESAVCQTRISVSTEKESAPSSSNYRTQRAIPNEAVVSPVHSIPECESHIAEGPDASFVQTSKTLPEQNSSIYIPKSVTSNMQSCESFAALSPANVLRKEADSQGKSEKAEPCGSSTNNDSNEKSGLSLAVGANGCGSPSASAQSNGSNITFLAASADSNAPILNGSGTRPLSTLKQYLSNKGAAKSDLDKNLPSSGADDVENCSPTCATARASSDCSTSRTTSMLSAPISPASSSALSGPKVPDHFPPSAATPRTLQHSSKVCHVSYSQSNAGLGSTQATPSARTQEDENHCLDFGVTTPATLSVTVPSVILTTSAGPFDNDSKVDSDKTAMQSCSCPDRIPKARVIKEKTLDIDNGGEQDRRETLSSKLMFRNPVGSLKTTILRQKVTPDRLSGTNVAPLANRIAFRGPQVKHKSSIQKTIAASVGQRSRSFSLPDQPTLISNRPEFMSRVPVQTVLLKPPVASGPASSTLLEATGDTVRPSSSNSSDEIVCSHADGAEHSSEFFHSQLQTNKRRSSFRLVGNSKAAYHEGASERNTVSSQKKPLRSILRKPTVNFDARKESRRQELPTQLETHSEDEPRPKTVDDRLKEGESVIQSLLPLIGSRRPRPRKKKCKQDSPTNLRSERESSNSTPTRGKATKRGAGRRRGRSKRRKRLPSISSDEDIIEELNAGAGQALPKPAKSLPPEAEASASEHEDSDDGLVSFMGVVPVAEKLTIKEKSASQDADKTIRNGDGVRNEDDDTDEDDLFSDSSTDSEEDGKPLSELAKKIVSVRSSKDRRSTAFASNIETTDLGVVDLIREENYHENIFTKFSKEMEVETDGFAKTVFGPSKQELSDENTESPPTKMDEKTVDSVFKDSTGTAVVLQGQRGESSVQLTSEAVLTRDKEEIVALNPSGVISSGSNDYCAVSTILPTPPTSPKSDGTPPKLNKGSSTDNCRSTSGELPVEDHQDVSQPEAAPNTDPAQSCSNEITETLADNLSVENVTACLSSEATEIRIGSPVDRTSALADDKKFYVSKATVDRPVDRTSLSNEAREELAVKEKQAADVRPVLSDEPNQTPLPSVAELAALKTSAETSSKPLAVSISVPTTSVSDIKSSSAQTPSKGGEDGLPCSTEERKKAPENQPNGISNLIAAAAELAGVTGSDGGEALNVPPTSTGGVHLGPDLSKKQEQANLINRPLDVAPRSISKQESKNRTVFSSDTMPESHSCHGFLEVCMSAPSRRNYALRRIPYVKTTTNSGDIPATNPCSDCVGGVKSPLATSSACATYLRLRDVICLIKIHPEALFSLVVRCEATLFSPNEYTRRLFTVVYDPVCKTDENMAKMTMRHSKGERLQEFLDHMIVLDKFLHFLLPRFYFEALGVQSSDVPRYVNVKIFKPIYDINEDVVKIFRQPYEYNSILRNKDDRIKCNSMKRKKFGIPSTNPRKRSRDGDFYGFAKRLSPLPRACHTVHAPVVSTTRSEEDVRRGFSMEGRPRFYLTADISRFQYGNASIAHSEYGAAPARTVIYQSGVMLEQREGGGATAPMNRSVLRMAPQTRQPASASSQHAAHLNYSSSLYASEMHDSNVIRFTGDQRASIIQNNSKAQNKICNARYVQSAPTVRLPRRSNLNGESETKASSVSGPTTTLRHFHNSRMDVSYPQGGLDKGVTISSVLTLNRTRDNGASCAPDERSSPTTKGFLRDMPVIFRQQKMDEGGVDETRTVQNKVNLSGIDILAEAAVYAMSEDRSHLKLAQHGSDENEGSDPSRGSGSIHLAGIVSELQSRVQPVKACGRKPKRRKDFVPNGPRPVKKKGGRKKVNVGALSTAQ